MVLVRSSRAPWLAWLLLLLGLFGTGCADRYFRTVEGDARPLVRYDLASWPERDYWTGLVLNGEKIGFGHTTLLPPTDGGALYELRSDATLAFNFLGFRKTVALKSRDWVTDDLRLVRFEYDYDLDGNRLALTGRVEDGALAMTKVTSGKTAADRIPLAEPLYPASAIAFYPVVRGLEMGRTYRYVALDGQRQRLETVSQTVEAYQESELFAGRAYKVETTMDGQASTTWIDARGLPILEMAMGRVLIATLESEQEAKSFLVHASLNKRDVLLEFSLVRPDRPLEQPRDLARLRVIVGGLPPGFRLPSDDLQRCEPVATRAACDIRRADPPPPDGPALSASEMKPYLAFSDTIDVQDPAIQRTAREIVGPAGDPAGRIRLLVEWLQRNIEQKPVDAFTSLDVLERKQGECQGITMLYTAFARSVGIPTKVVNGLVYSPEFGGFLYHAWAESYVGGGWLPVDPTYGQVGADATHLKLIEGERPADLLPLVDIVGQITLDIPSPDRPTP